MADEQPADAQGMDSRARADMPPWSEPFLEALLERPSIYRAQRLAGVSRGAIWAARKRSAAFREAWDEALESHLTGLEGRTWDRAVHGWTDVDETTDPEGGVTVKKKRQWNPRLATWILERRGKGYAANPDADPSAGYTPPPIVLTDAAGAAAIQEIERLRARVAELEAQGGQSDAD